MQTAIDRSTATTEPAADARPSSLETGFPTIVRPSRRASWVHLPLILGAVIMMFPFYWMLTSAVKSLDEASAFPPTMWPTQLLWENFPRAWQAAPFGRYLVNTVFVALSQMTLVIVTSSLAAYAFALVPFKGKNVVFVCFLATMMIPLEVLIIPDFIILKNLGWYDTFLALIIPWATSVFAIFLLRQFFMSIPSELWDAAQIDGCGRFGFLWRVAVPLAKPAIITVGLLSFHGAWNALLWPLLMTGSTEMRLLQTGLAAFQTETRVQYHLWMAAAALTMAPMLIIFFVAQRYFIEGASRSGIKG